MELTLKVNGKDTVFKQEKVTFRTIQKALDYQDLIIQNNRAMQALANIGIDDEIEYDDYEQDPKKDLDQASDLIVSYFDGQFTYDEFLEGAYFESVHELYGVAHLIMLEILTAKETEVDTKKTGRQRKK